MVELLSADDLALIFNSSPHPYLILRPDEHFTIAGVNDRYLEATRTAREQIVGRGLFDVFPDNPDDLATTSVSDLRTSLELVQRQRIQDTMGVQKYDIPRPDGPGFEVKYWSPVNTPVFAPDGSIALIIHHAEDVTAFMLARQEEQKEQTRAENSITRMEAEVLHRADELKAANREIKTAMEKLASREAELERLNGRLQELDRAKTDFFSNISHEFRTPLTLILGPLENLLDDPNLDPAHRTTLDVMQRNTLRLLKLVNTLLDFSRIEAGRVKASYRPTDLAKATTELASHFHSACEKAALDLVIDCPDLSEPVFVDHDMWEKIVLNLISNAFKFTLEGEIAVRLHENADTVALVVEDSGVGIPAHELPHLFERFHRVEGSQGRSFEGSGIGLALVQELVKLHGGTIAVASTPGVGSSFKVVIPKGHTHLPADALHPADETARSSGARAFLGDTPHAPTLDETTATPSIGLNLFGKQPRILVADDNGDMRDYISRILVNAGCEVQTRSDGLAALAAIATTKPDLVLSDVMMPGLDGFKLLSEIRKNLHTEEIPVILLSARAGEEARVEGLSAGADDYMVKPFSARELIARVEGSLRLAKLRQDKSSAERKIVERALGLTEHRLALAVESAQMGLWDFDIPTGTLTWSPICKAMFGLSENFPINFDFFFSVVHPEDRERVELLCRHCMDPAIRQPYDAQYRIFLPDGSPRWIMARGKCLFDGDKPLRFIGSAIDITEQKEAEVHLRIMVDELSHRVKNALAVIQSITEQTFRTGKDTDTIRRTLEGRLRSLAETHTLLTMSRWESVDLSSLVTRSVKHGVDDAASNLLVTGPPAKLTPKASLSLGLILHELSTNATKYGAWAHDGAVTVSWRLSSGELVLEWTETGLSGIMPPGDGQTGFGTRLIDRLVTYDMDGEIERHYSPSGFRCILTAPTKRVLATATGG